MPRSPPRRPPGRRLALPQTQPLPEPRTNTAAPRPRGPPSSRTRPRGTQSPKAAPRGPKEPRHWTRAGRRSPPSGCGLPPPPTAPPAHTPRLGLRRLQPWAAAGTARPRRGLAPEREQPRKGEQRGAQAPQRNWLLPRRESGHPRPALEARRGPSCSSDFAPSAPPVVFRGCGRHRSRGLTGSLRRRAYNSRRAHRVPPLAPPRGTFAARGQGAGRGQAACGPRPAEPPVAAARQPARQGPAARGLPGRSPGLRPALPRRVGQEGGPPGRQS